MIAKFRGLCTCGIRFAAGEQVTYSRAQRAVVGCPACATPFRARLEAIAAAAPFGSKGNPEVVAAAAMVGRDPGAARRELWRNAKGWLKPFVTHRHYTKANPELFEPARNCARAALAAMMVCREAETAKVRTAA